MSETTTHEGVNMVKLIWRTFWILLAITIIEVGAALSYMSADPQHLHKMAINMFFVVASLMKAYFIVKVFMHMRFEVKTLVITVLVPMIFLIYAVIMLLWEGDSWLHMRAIPY